VHHPHSPARERDLRDEPDAEAALTDLYRLHALRLIRLGYVMLGDRQAAEDVVQDAFAGLYRRWGRLADHARAPQYLRSSVLNGCRSAIRRNRPGMEVLDFDPAVVSAEADVLAGEQQRVLMRAIRRLPQRQREALVLRYYQDLSEAQIASAMGVTPGAVHRYTARGRSALRARLELSPHEPG